MTLWFKNIFIALVCLTVLSSRPAAAQTVVADAEIRQKITAYLEQCYANTASRYETEWVSHIGVWQLGSTVDSIVVRYGQRHLPRGLAVFRIEAIQNQRVIRRLSYSARVRVFAPVLVARRDIQVDEPLAPQQFDVVEQEVTNLNGRLFSDAAQLSNLQARRNIRKGTVLTDELTEEIPVVTRGSIITLLYQTGRVQVALQARAQQDGGIGDEIWCMTDTGKRRYRARIESADAATLIP
jgi:flagella basal body P-ring formation protein FlgA